MDLLPATSTCQVEVQLVHEVGREFVLGRVLAPLLNEYDIVLIDCQPSLGLLTVNTLACADGVLSAAGCEYFAMRGVALLMERRQGLNQAESETQHGRASRHHV
jgi:chromosome partitioning protein